MWHSFRNRRPKQLAWTSSAAACSLLLLASVAQSATAQSDVAQTKGAQSDAAQSGTPQQSLQLPNPATRLSTAPSQLDAKAISQSLYEITVTVRISSKSPSQGGREDNSGAEDQGKVAKGVTVSTGVSLGEGRIITFSEAPLAADYRVTLPDGEQVNAKLRVVDYYSGLRLLEIDDRELPQLATSDEAVPGEAILSASAAGIEKPVLALGLLGRQFLHY